MSPETHQAVGDTLKTLLTIAWLAPLAGFAVEILAGYWSTRVSKAAAFIAVGCIGLGFVLSASALVYWGNQTGWQALRGEGHHAAAEEHAAADPAHAAEAHPPAAEESAAGAMDHSAGEHGRAATAFSGTFYALAHFGSLRLSLDYYIDSLTLVMYTMVTLIATCIHVFAIGYMSDELTDDYVDHQVHDASGGHFHRPGRFYLFFAYMSLFSFSMLGLVLAGNIFQVFIFWELVGICSYLLIGFYVERRSASTAANKAFIMNRIGDWGFLIGLMVLWTYFGTFSFGNYTIDDGHTEPGLFQMARGNDGRLDVDLAQHHVYLRGVNGERLIAADTQLPKTIPYYLLIVAGLGVFAGCIGKSAQFPLQTWLPDAMEGPTPVSALVHSATMVAAGVYLAGRFFPMFTPQVLLVIAYVGCITLFVAATIAIVATDIKRVLAYSTISQLGYMMLAIGLGGWGAGLFHLITHAFFKSLMFLCAGSVIVACHHEQEMPRMGGLLKKLPITGFAMLVGVIAISGLAVPGLSVYGALTFGEVLAFSGYHSKDAIVATALAYSQINATHFLLFVVPLLTAGITAFYMFRLWFMTFRGRPRDRLVYEHARENPWVMAGPLVVLSFFAIFCAVGGEHGPLFRTIMQSEPVVAGEELIVPGLPTVLLPAHADVEEVHSQAGAYALLAAVIGAILAYLLYDLQVLDPADIKRQLAGLHRFLREKWQFDTLYDVMFARPVHVVARWCATFDRVVLDGILHGASRLTIDVSQFDRKFDEGVVDGLVNFVGDVVFATGRSLRTVQTGRLRQYVMFIAVGVVALFVLLFAFFPK